MLPHFTAFTCSIVIPVHNSESLVGETADRGMEAGVCFGVA